MSAGTEAIVEWLRQTLLESAARGFVFGLDGGAGTAVVARLCQAAAPANVVGVVMPCHGDRQDEEDARFVASHFQIPIVRADLSPAYDVLIEDLHGAVVAVPEEQRAGTAAADDPGARVPSANVRPRLRMATLYFLADSLNYLVAGAGNRSALALGSFTKYGDAGADVLPIGHLLAREVEAAARELGVPESIINPTGPGPGPIGDADAGVTGAALENYLMKGPQAVAPALAMRIERLIRRSEHKRALPAIPETHS